MQSKREQPRCWFFFFLVVPFAAVCADAYKPRLERSYVDVESYLVGAKG